MPAVLSVVDWLRGHVPIYEGSVPPPGDRPNLGPVEGADLLDGAIGEGGQRFMHSSNTSSSLPTAGRNLTLGTLPAHYE